MPKLLIIEGIGKGTTYEISGDVSFGRSSSNLIKLFGGQISREHAVIAKQDNKFIFRDLNSKNGVYVNAKRVKEYTLSEGDEISIGTVKLVFEPTFEMINIYGKEDCLIILPDGDNLSTSMITRALPKDTGPLMDISEKKKSGHSTSNLEILNRRLRALYEISSLSGSELKEEDLLKKSCDAIFEAIKAERIAILFSSESGDEIHPVLICSKDKEAENIAISQTILTEVIKKKQAVFSPDATEDSRFYLSESIQLDKLKSIICVPLLTKNRVLGAVYADTKDSERYFREDDLYLLIAIARQLAVVIENNRLYNRLNDEVKTLREKIQDEINLIGENKAMAEIINTVYKIAPTDTKVLIIGETGTGKELLARAIHYNSQRRDKPFVTVDCSTIPATLIESELFGHEKGSFTGADKATIGKFEQADGGTIFLDEISTMDLNAQAKFLRVLEENKFTRIGGVKVTSINVRVIAASNEDLEALIKQGRFRVDLYHRLAVVPLNLPPLRARKDDIEVLAKYFIDKFAKIGNKTVNSITPDAVKYLQEYPWPGNVRELKNVIERVVVLCDKATITPQELPANITKKNIPSIIAEKHRQNKVALGEIIRQMEKEYIAQVLNENRGRKTVSARILKISRPTLDKKIKEYGLEV
jgi:Nif-specific regulatory protein